MKYNSIFQFTHSDLDGVGCAILCDLKFGKSSNIMVEYCSYGNIDEKLQEFCKKENLSVDDLLLITDICPSEETCEMLHNIKDETNLCLIDHHKTKRSVSKYSWSVFDVDFCATKLTMDWMELEKDFVKNFVFSVDAWDMWRTSSDYRPRGENLNSLVGFLGLEEFKNEMLKSKNLNADVENLRDVIRHINENKKRYVKQVIDEQLMKAQYMMDGLANTFKILYATDFISEIGHAALNYPEAEDLHYVVIVNPLKNTCSLRSRKNGVDVSTIAKILGGGGHKSASGFVYNCRRKLNSTIHNLLLNKLDEKL